MEPPQYRRRYAHLTEALVELGISRSAAEDVNSNSTNSTEIKVKFRAFEKNENARNDEENREEWRTLINNLNEKYFHLSEEELG